MTTCRHLLSVDTETTGVDFHHGSRPFLVTTCADGQQPEFWEWDVDPISRIPEIPESEAEEIRVKLGCNTQLVLQNPKFDVTALDFAGVISDWPWDRTYDTLTAGHLLASNHPHDLTSMVRWYLGRDIQPYEDALEVACKKARDYVRRHFPNWRIATEGFPDMPSAKGGKSEKRGRGGEDEKPWKLDTWLPRRVAQELGPKYYPDDHPWWTVCSEYACADSYYTLELWKVMEAEIRRLDLWEIYLIQVQILPICKQMEYNGVTVDKEQAIKQRVEYLGMVNTATDTCLEIAESFGYDLKMPNGAAPNNSLREFCFDHLKLEERYSKKGISGAPTLDKNAKAYYISTLPRGPALTFIKSLSDRQAGSKALTDLAGYESFWLPINERETRWYRLYPSLNPTGTDHLRMACYNPNGQNISNREGFSLRSVFAPAPDREFWSLDAKNIERRIPAYEAKELEIIALFERPNDPPYFGSEHLLIAHILYPVEFNACRDERGRLDGRIFKKLYKATLYQWVKNGNFAIQYSAGEITADLTYHRPGAKKLIGQRFTKQEELNSQCLAYAKKYGYVETIPDKTVNPRRGYPILCARTEWGEIMPTTPLNYHVSGTAMWWMRKAMIRCHAQIDDWRKKGWDVSISLQVHDELLFDFPKAAHPKKNPKASNLGMVRQLCRLMEQGGDDIGIPTPVNVEYHEHNWSVGVSV